MDTQKARKESLSPTPVAGTTELCDNVINSISVQGSWEGLSSVIIARYFRERILSKRYLVNWLRMKGRKDFLYIPFVAAGLRREHCHGWSCNCSSKTYPKRNNPSID
jgi:hypothetical protein